MIDQFGLEAVEAYMGHVQDNAEECVRRVISALRDGRYAYELDNGAKIVVSVSVDHDAREADDRLHRHFGLQDELNYNAPLAVCHAVVLYVFRTLVGAEIPLNRGLLRAAQDHRARRDDDQRGLSLGGDRRQHRGQPGHVQRPLRRRST